MYTVTKQHLVGGGQYFKGDSMALLISTAPGMTTNMALATALKEIFGWDLTRSVV